MATFSVDQVIERPVEEVFGFVRDVRNSPAWQTGIETLRVFPDAPLEVGSVVMETRRIQGRELDLSYKVTEVRPYRLVEIQSTGGPVEYRATQELKPEGTSTRLRLSVDVELHGAMRLAAGLIAPAIKRQAKADLSKLAVILERRE